MKRLGILVVVVLFLTMVLVGVTADKAYSQAAAPVITLTPTSGFAATTVSGTGFDWRPSFHLLGLVRSLPTVPTTVYVGAVASDGYLYRNYHGAHSDQAWGISGYGTRPVWHQCQYYL